MTDWIVCPTCRGDGTVLNDAFRGVPLDQDLAHDPDFIEEMQAGVYDVTCPTCRGQRVVDGSPEAVKSREDYHEWEEEIRREQLMLGEY